MHACLCLCSESHAGKRCFEHRVGTHGLQVATHSIFRTERGRLSRSHVSFFVDFCLTSILFINSLKVITQQYHHFLCLACNLALNLFSIPVAVKAQIFMWAGYIYVFCEALLMAHRVPGGSFIEQKKTGNFRGARPLRPRGRGRWPTSPTPCAASAASPLRKVGISNVRHCVTFVRKLQRN